MNGHVSSQTEWVSIVGRLPPVDCFIVIMTQILRFYMQRNWKIKVKHGIYVHWAYKLNSRHTTCFDSRPIFFLRHITFIFNG